MKLALSILLVASWTGTAFAQDPPAEPEPEPEPDPVEVTIREPPKSSDTTTLTRAETRSIPGAFGDPFRAIETMPSLAPLASGIPYFYVRGAPPGNVGYFLDGIRVPLLFHLGLGPSVIHPSLIDRVELTAGPSPELGRYAGGVVSGTLAAPRENFRVEGSLRAVDTGAFVELPFLDGRGDVLGAGRVSYTAALFSALNSDVVLNYWDYAGRFSYELAPGHRLGVFAFGAYDYLGEKQDDGSESLLVDTMFHRLDFFYDVTLNPRTQLAYDVVLSLDQTSLDQDREVIDRGLTARAKLSHRANDELQVLAGFDLTADDYDVDLDRGADEGFTSFFSSRTDIALGAYVVLPWVIDRHLSIRPGLRFDAYVSGGEFALSLDPSISARVDIYQGAGQSLALVQTHGLASQTPSFIVAGPGFRPGLDQGGLQRAFSSSAALEWKPDEAWFIKAGAYRSFFFALNDALGTSALGGDGFLEGFDAFDERFDGTSMGLELSLKRRLSSKIGLIAAYSFGRSERTDDRGRTFPSGFDRTHVASAAISYDFGRGWRGGVKQVLYSGTPLLKIEDDAISVKKRLPPFYRMDWRIEKKWTIGKTGYVSFVAEVLNTFLAPEALGEDCFVDKDGDGTEEEVQGECAPTKLGPVAIPSIGVEGGY